MSRVANTQPLRQKQPREKDEKHLAFIRKLPCVICGQPSEAAHVRYTTNWYEKIYGKRHSGKQEKPDDRWAVPLCPSCHRLGKEAQHNMSEFIWWCRKHKHPLRLANRLYEISGDQEAGERIVREVRNE